METKLAQGESERTKLQRQLEHERRQADLARKEAVEERKRAERVQQQSRRNRSLQWVVGAGVAGAAIVASLALVYLGRLDLQLHVARTITVLLSIGGGLGCASGLTLRRESSLQGLKWPKWLRRLTGVYWLFVVLPLAVGYLANWLS